MKPLGETQSARPSTWASEVTSTRRNFIAKLGASALAASALLVVQAKGGSAFSNNYYCCCLIVAPPNIPYSICAQFGYYIWSCTTGPYLCNCCEMYEDHSEGCYSTYCSGGSCQHV